MTRIYHDAEGNILFTTDVDDDRYAPEGDYILHPDPIATIGAWRVEGGALVPRDGWAEAEAHRRREAASLSRVEFLDRAVRFGMVSAEAAIMAAKGDVPPEFEQVLAGLPPEDMVSIQIRWAGATEIERLHPVILAMAGALGVTDEQLDVLFDVDLTGIGS